MKRKKNDESDGNEEVDFDFDNEGILLSVSYYQTKEEENREHDEFIGQFNLVKLAPIEVQEGINFLNEQKKEFVDHDFGQISRNIWNKQNIHEENLATRVFF